VYKKAVLVVLFAKGFRFYVACANFNLQSFSLLFYFFIDMNYNSASVGAAYSDWKRKPDTNKKYFRILSQEKSNRRPQKVKLGLQKVESGMKKVNRDQKIGFIQ
jgi:hypothetical protein